MQLDSRIIFREAGHEQATRINSRHHERTLVALTPVLAPIFVRGCPPVEPSSVKPMAGRRAYGWREDHMHPDKEQALKELAVTAQELDAEIVELKTVVSDPEKIGVTKTLGALLTMSVVGAGAVIVDGVSLLIRGIPDSQWESN